MLFWNIKTKVHKFLQTKAYVKICEVFCKIKPTPELNISQVTHVKFNNLLWNIKTIVSFNCRLMKF